VNTRLKELNISAVECGLDTVVATHITTAGLEHSTSMEEHDLSMNNELSAGDHEAVGCAIERC